MHAHMNNVFCLRMDGLIYAHMYMHAQVIKVHCQCSSSVLQPLGMYMASLQPLFHVIFKVIKAMLD